MNVAIFMEWSNCMFVIKLIVQYERSLLACEYVTTESQKLTTGTLLFLPDQKSLIWSNNDSLVVVLP